MKMQTKVNIRNVFPHEVTQIVAHLENLSQTKAEINSLSYIGRWEYDKENLGITRRTRQVYCKIVRVEHVLVTTSNEPKAKPSIW